MDWKLGGLETSLLNVRALRAFVKKIAHLLLAFCAPLEKIARLWKKCQVPNSYILLERAKERQTVRTCYNPKCSGQQVEKTPLKVCDFNFVTSIDEKSRKISKLPRKSYTVEKPIHLSD